MKTETANEYLSRCPHWKDCGEVIASPWGFVSKQALMIGPKKLLLVGLNDNRSKEGDLPPNLARRDDYSNYFKQLIKGEVNEGKPRYISNLMPPIARFLFGNDSQDSQRQALEIIEFCNVISCCPKPSLDGNVAPASKPSTKMVKNCGSRLKNKEDGVGHELLHRLSRLQPTHILVLGKDAKYLWEKASHPGSVLSETLSQNSRPIVIFVPHPSQRDRSRVSRDKYWDLVYTRLTEAPQIPYGVPPHLPPSHTSLT